MSMKIKVEFEMKIPDATHEEIYDWLRFELGVNGVIEGNHPLIGTALEADPDYSISFDVEDYYD